MKWHNIMRGEENRTNFNFPLGAMMIICILMALFSLGIFFILA